MVTVDELKMKYPDANAWQMGDSPELANELAALIKKELKRPPAALMPLTRRKSLPQGLGAITSSLTARMYRYA